MATIPLTTNERQYGGAVSDGNLTTCQFVVKTNAASIVQGSPYATAAASGDIIDLGPLQEGMRLEDAQVIVNAPLTAAGAAKLGFKYENGVDDAKVPQDDDYFGTFALGAAARVRATGAVGPIVLPKAARLILTLAAAGAANGSATVLVYGEQTGPL